MKIAKRLFKLAFAIIDGIANLIYLLFCVAAAMVGYTIHGSICWSIVDFFFWPLALIKWLICHQINLTVIKHTFGFLLS
jgi:hypothetical protein